MDYTFWIIIAIISTPILIWGILAHRTWKQRREEPRCERCGDKLTLETTYIVFGILDPEINVCESCTKITIRNQKAKCICTFSVVIIALLYIWTGIIIEILNEKNIKQDFFKIATLISTPIILIGYAKRSLKLINYYKATDPPEE